MLFLMLNREQLEKEETGKYSRLRFIPAAILMAVIFFHSAMPAEQSLAESSLITDLLLRLFHVTLAPQFMTFLVRKAAHFTEYFLLGTSLRWASDSSGIMWAAGTLYAVTDEVHQLLVPGRSCELRDICIDAAGVLTGVLLMAALRKRSGV